MDKDRMTFSQVNLLLNMGVSMVPQQMVYFMENPKQKWMMGGTPILAFEEPSISQIAGKPMPTTAKHVCKCVTRLLLGPVRPFQRVGRVGIECAKV